MQSIKPAAATYILGMKDVMWRGTSWLDDNHPVPPRYGMLTSNTSESANAMLADAREVGWLKAAEKIVDIMSTKISHCRQKYKQCHRNEIVPSVAQLVKKQWSNAASLEVVELEEGCDQFKVVNCSAANYNAPGNDCIPGMALLNGHQSIHILKPERR